MSKAVSFLMTTAMLVFIFAVLVSAMIYIMHYYDASYLCRRVVRSIEITGVYDEAETRSIVDDMAGSGLEDIDVQVDAVYFSGNKIQLTLTKPPKTNVPPSSIPAAMTARNITLGATTTAEAVTVTTMMMIIITTPPLPTP